MRYKFAKPIHATIGSSKYKCSIEWRNGIFIADEAISSGGKDSGPDPFTLLISSLASCMLITMRMYVEHKGWIIPEIAVEVNMYQEKWSEKNKTVIDSDIIFHDSVDEKQKLRLQQIAAHCPISRMLENEIKINTVFYNDLETNK